ncbi:CHAD domain-containing protein [Xylanimonas protaetiae]|uniref:CHAD domain-containing protein n=1 Tax=Xylanimonas protaetiae TaxID=2509457 RepID=A0A4P6F8J1_9MICO|nr:CHAD domain-containing protein [Xylanimonas protaetiae]QAY69607.1 CHAD domain-containing protein [Xylanimonas protaetiae]
MGTRASDLLSAALRDHVAALAAAEADLLAGGPDAVHDARVTLRRLRADLGEFPRLVDADVAADLRDRLQAWGRLLGEARDLEVVLGMLDDDAVPEATRTAARAAWTARWDAARAAAVAHLGTAEHARLTADLAATAAHPPLTRRAGRSWKDELPRGLRRSRRRVERRDRRLADLAAGSPGASLDTAEHSVRKAVRRARYAAEVLARGTGRKAARAADTAARLARRQDDLGAAHDRTLLRQALEEVTDRGA